MQGFSNSRLLSLRFFATLCIFALKYKAVNALTECLAGN
jgi:hypothetical protein